MKPIRTVSGLVDVGLIPPARAAALRPVAEQYPLAITPEMVVLIDPDDPADPIAKAFVPTPAELFAIPEERADPIGDAAHTPVPGIVHRHRDRLLFTPALTCPVFCRFCFRRAKMGRVRALMNPAEMEAAYAYIGAHPDVREVILTGGDPFVLGAKAVAAISARLGAIGHVGTVRWHTRVPMVDPVRIDDDFVRALKIPDKAVYVAVHADHPREFTALAKAACARLVDAGIPLLGQSVLLAGINNDLDTLEALMRAYLENRIKPYYLHHPDLAQGTSHFRVRIEDGIALVRALRARASGLAIPHYVIDIPGGFGKVPLDSGMVERTDDGWRIQDHAGVWHDYPGTGPRDAGPSGTSLSGT